MTARNAFGAAALSLLFALGCAPQLAPYPPALREDGALHLYLQPLPQEAQRLVIQLAEVSAIREDGTLAPLQLLLPELEGAALLGVQRRLAVGALPPGTYKGISLHVERAVLLDGESSADILIPEDPLLLEMEFRIASRVAATLFVTLDPEGLASDRVRFAPRFFLTQPSRQLRSLLAYATSARSNIVSVFNKHTMEIVDTIATSSGPSGAVIDRKRGWVYVALAGDDAIEAIEVNTGVILHRLQMKFGDEPVELALSHDGQLLVSANRGSNTASIIDATVLREIDRVRLSSEPSSVVTAVTGGLAYAIQSLGNAVSEIDLSRREVTRTLLLDETPVRIAASRDGNELYVITRYGSDLLVVDATNLILKSRIEVGPGANCVVADPKTGLVYVGRQTGGISVIDASSLMPIDRIRVNGAVAFLDIDRDRNGLFALLPDRRLVQKIDLVSKRLDGAVEIGEEGYAVVSMGSR